MLGEHLHPALQGLHDGPGLGEVHHDKGQCVLETLLLQGKLQQRAVVDNAIQDPHSHSG